jgi:hypothetical protein
VNRKICVRRTGTDDTLPDFSLPPKAVAKGKPSKAELQAYLNGWPDDFSGHGFLTGLMAGKIPLTLPLDHGSPQY